MAVARAHNGGARRAGVGFRHRAAGPGEGQMSRPGVWPVRRGRAPWAFAVLLAASAIAGSPALAAGRTATATATAHASPGAGTVAAISAEAAVPIPRAQARPHRICFYAASPHGPIPTGHGFVQLLPPAGSGNPQAGRTDLVYGHHPKTEPLGNPGHPAPPSLKQWPFSSQGSIWDDSNHAWDWKICYDVTVEQYNRAVRFIRAQIDNPPDFHLFSTNCTYWITRVAATAGITLPSVKTTRFPFRYFLPNLADPEALENALKAIGAGRTFKGGVVHDNPNHVTAKNSKDPPATMPDTCSAYGLAESAFANPGGLATALHGLAAETTQAHLSVGRARTFTLSLAQHTTALDLTNALIEVDWGDGSLSMSSTTLGHAYAHAGARTIRAIVVEPGEIARLTIPVTVLASGPAVIDHWTLPAPKRGRAIGDGAQPPPPDQTALAQTFKLTVTKSGTGSGNVSDNSNTINCGATCSAEYAPNTVVTLAAGADVGSVFVGWTGACTGANSGCTVTMTAATTVDAQFDTRGAACAGTRQLEGTAAQVTIACLQPFAYVRITGPEGDLVSEAQGPPGWTATPSGNAVVFTSANPAPADTAEPYLVNWQTAPAGVNTISAVAGASQADAVAVTFT